MTTSLLATAVLIVGCYTGLGSSAADSADSSATTTASSTTTVSSSEGSSDETGGSNELDCSSTIDGIVFYHSCSSPEPEQSGADGPLVLAWNEKWSPPDRESAAIYIEHHSTALQASEWMVQNLEAPAIEPAQPMSVSFAGLPATQYKHDGEWMFENSTFWYVGVKMSDEDMYLIRAHVSSDSEQTRAGRTETIQKMLDAIEMLERS